MPFIHGKTKLFCIGFHKTGTGNLDRFLKNLGLRSIHWPNKVGGVDFQAKVAPVWKSNDAVIDALMPVIQSYDAHSDVPYSGLYRTLGQRFPDAKFILSTRNVDRWWDSLSYHWGLRLFNRRVFDPFERIQYQSYLPSNRNFARKSDEDIMKQAFLQHNSDVKSFFNPKTLLFFDIEDPNKATKICQFLRINSSIPFPSSQPRMPEWRHFMRLARARVKNRGRFGSWPNI